MKIKIDKDEWYPVYSLSKVEGDVEVNIPKEIVDLICSVESAFSDVQAYLGELSDVAWKKKTASKDWDNARDKY